MSVMARQAVEISTKTMGVSCAGAAEQRCEMPQSIRFNRVRLFEFRLDG